MRFFLPFFILSLITYHLSLVSPSYAQEVTPTITSSSQINPQAGNAWESFIDTLIPKTLKDVNCSNLPLEACEGIKNANTTSDESKSSVKPQENPTDNKQNVVEGAYQYNVRSGISLPSDVGKSSTNKNDAFGGIIDFINNLLAIFNIGNKAADQSARKDLPIEVGDTIINQKSAMNDSLPISQCGELPAGLCTENRPNAL